MKTRRLVLSSLAAIFVCALAGCASQPESKLKTAANDDAEYEWVKPLGSNIKVRVRKGTTVRTGVSPTSAMTGDEVSQTVSSVGGTTGPKAVADSMR